MQDTRERILGILKERNEATVDELSRELGLTAVTVRHHLDILRGEGYIAPPIVRRRKTPGRPQYAYILTEEASSFFPKRYDHLAKLMLDDLRSCLSSAEIDQMMKRIGERVASQAGLSDEGSFENRVAAVVEFLDELGYMARWEKGDQDEYLLHIANCPYEQVASEHTEICRADMSMLTSLLGTPPRRVDWAAGGDHQCTYAIRPPGE